MPTQASRKWGLGPSLDELLADAASLGISVVETEVSAQSAAMTQLNAEGPQAAAHARKTADALARDAALLAKGEDKLVEVRVRNRGHRVASTARRDEELAKLPALVQIVNELQEQVAELQKIVGADVRMMDVQTVNIVFEYPETQQDIDEKKLFAPFEGKIPVSKYPTEAKRAYNRIATRKADAKKAAKKAKIAALAKREAELKALKERQAVMPGSAVFHS